MTTGQRIKAARQQAGLTQTELAEKLGIPYQSISQWERDLRNPKYENLQRIANALNYDVEALIESDVEYDARMDEQFLRIIAPHLVEPDPLSDAEIALNTILNSLGYGIGKIRGNYYFQYHEGFSVISQEELDGLFSGAKSGLDIAAKTLKLKLIRSCFKRTSKRQPAEKAPESTETPLEGKDTTPDETPTETPQNPPEKD